MQVFYRFLIFYCVQRDPGDEKIVQCVIGSCTTKKFFELLLIF